MIDSHCHLADEAFAGDLDAVVRRAREVGVSNALCVLTAGEPAELRRSTAVEAAWPGIRFAAGVHPHIAGRFAGRAPEVEREVRQELALRNGACAVGEIGLDYHYDLSPRSLQREVFAVQVELARSMGLPLVIHTREADADTLGILAESGPGRLRGVFHCFSGDIALARAALDLGFLVSFAGIVTFPSAGALVEVARFVPSDRLLVETDCPYLAPVPRRGKRNEPAWVTFTAAALAAALGVALAELERTVEDNFSRLFGRAPIT